MHLVLALSIIDDEPDIPASGLLILVCALFGALGDDCLESREEGGVGKDGLDLGFGERVGETWRAEEERRCQLL